MDAISPEQAKELIQNEMDGIKDRESCAFCLGLVGGLYIAGILNEVEWKSFGNQIAERQIAGLTLMKLPINRGALSESFARIGNNDYCTHLRPGLICNPSARPATRRRRNRGRKGMFRPFS